MNVQPIRMPPMRDFTSAEKAQMLYDLVECCAKMAHSASLKATASLEQAHAANRVTKEVYDRDMKNDDYGGGFSPTPVMPNSDHYLDVLRKEATSANNDDAVMSMLMRFVISHFIKNYAPEPKNQPWS